MEVLFLHGIVVYLNMPAKNVIRIDVEDTYYHIYNRGVEKRIIFCDDQDYKVFLKYLKESLSPPPDRKDLIKTLIFKEENFKGIPKQPKNLFNKLELIVYSLMPNHFHLMIHQIKKGNIEIFMRSLLVRYSMYFNKRYERVGSLFQGPYKSIIIDNENYLLHLSRYIHLNPSENFKDLTKAYSSYAEYLGIRKTIWVKPDVILKYFSQVKSDFKSVNTYKGFVENYKKDSSQTLEELILES